MLTEIFPTGCSFGPAKGRSSASELAVSKSGICFQPMKDLMPLSLSLCRFAPLKELGQCRLKSDPDLSQTAPFPMLGKQCEVGQWG